MTMKEQTSTYANEDRYTLFESRFENPPLLMRLPVRRMQLQPWRKQTRLR